MRRPQPLALCQHVAGPGHLCASRQRTRRPEHFIVTERPCGEELEDEVVQGSFRLPLLELTLPSVFTIPPSALPHHLAPCYSGAGLWINDMGVTWGLVRNAASWACQLNQTPCYNDALSYLKMPISEKCWPGHPVPLTPFSCFGAGPPPAVPVVVGEHQKV